MQRLCRASVIILTSLALPSVSQAQTGNAAKAMIAATLNDQALREMESKDYQSACPRLVEVTRLVPDSHGAWLNLGKCYWGLERLASAWITYKHAADIAGGAQARAEATKWVKKLEPRLSRITLLVPESVRALPELQVYRDGLLAGSGQWGLAIPVDKGSHTIVATAKGKQRWETTVVVDAEGNTQAVMIDGLREEEPPSPPPAPPRSTVLVDASVYLGPSIMIGNSTPGIDRIGFAFGAALFVAPFRWFGVGVIYERGALGGVNLGPYPAVDITARGFDTLWAGVRLQAPDIGRIRFSAVFAPGVSWQRASLSYCSADCVGDSPQHPTPPTYTGIDGPRFTLRAGIIADVVLSKGFSLVFDTTADNFRFSAASIGTYNDLKTIIIQGRQDSPVQVLGTGILTLIGVHAGFAYRFEL